MVGCTIASVTSKSEVHIQKEVSHLFLHHTRRWVDIVIIKDNFQTMADIVIADPTCLDLVKHASTMTMHVTIVTIQDKARSYTKWAPRDDFIPLAIETYGCLHPRFDSFLIICVHAYVACHQQTSLIPSMLISHYKQQVLIAL